MKWFSHSPHSEKKLIHTVQNTQLLLVLPLLGKLSLQKRTKLQKLVKENHNFCKLSVILRTHTSLSNFFRFKDLNATCIGESLRRLKVQANEHMGVTPLTGKISTSSSQRAIKEHLHICDHVASRLWE